MEAELAALDVCTNHDDCAACIERLETACTAHALLQALHAPRAAPTPHPLLALLRARAMRAAPAAGALFRLLSVPPVTEADDALLARLLVLLERALRDDLTSEGAASAPSTSGSLVSPSTGTLFAPADALPGRLLASLVGSGCAVLDLSKESPPPLAHGELPPARFSPLSNLSLISKLPSLCAIEKNSKMPIVPTTAGQKVWSGVCW